MKDLNNEKSTNWLSPLITGWPLFTQDTAQNSWSYAGFSSNDPQPTNLSKCHPRWCRAFKTRAYIKPTFCSTNLLFTVLKKQTNDYITFYPVLTVTDKNVGGWWWRWWTLVSPDGVAPSRMVSVSASVNLPWHHKVHKFSSGTDSIGCPGKEP